MATYTPITTNPSPAWYGEILAHECEPAQEPQQWSENVLFIAPKAQDKQTYSEFIDIVKKYAPVPLAYKNTPDNCTHRRAYGNRHQSKMVCPECGFTCDPQNDFEKRLCAPHSSSGYVNWRLR